VKYRIILAVVLISLQKLAFSQSFIAGTPFIRNFSTIEYQAGIQNWHITQDARGILYVANNFGLLEFDGSNWEVYQTINGSKMRSVAVDPNGKIHVGGQRDFGYFFPDDSGQLIYTSLADSLPSAFRNFDETWNLFLDGDRQYYCTFSNIYIFDSDTITVVQPSNPLELSFFVNRELWVDERGYGLSRLEDDKLTLVPGGEFFKDIRISSILPLYDNRYLISTSSEGIFEYTSSTIKPWNPVYQSKFKEAIINVMIRLKSGNYAIGTQNEGLFIVNSTGEPVRHFTTGRGLDNRTVLSLMEDDLQNLWVGLNNGLSYIELGSPFTFIDESNGLPGTGYSAFLDNNTLYLGTNTGLYQKDISKEETFFTLVDGTQGQVYHIGKYEQDILLGHHGGAFRIENGRAYLLSSEPGSWIFQQVRHAPELLVGGLYGGLQLFRKKDNHWIFEKKIEGFKESSRLMEQDREGNLWITHGYKGVFKIIDFLSDQASVEFYGNDRGFPSNMLINVYTIRNELIFTSENGIYKYDKHQGRFFRDPFFTKLFGESVQLWKVQEDALGRIYFIGRDQIGILSKTVTGEYLQETSSFNMIRRFLNDDLETIVVLNNNEILFGAKDGFIHYDPNRKINRDATFKTLIRRFGTTTMEDSTLYFGNQVRNGKVVITQPDDQIITLPYYFNSVALTYAATSFESDEHVLHQFKLENFDLSWSEWTTSTRKEYTNLGEGTYTFRVRSKNAFGEVSNEAKYTFIISPPWYRTPWAYLGYFSAIVSVLFLNFIIIDRKHKHEKRVLTLKQKKELIQKEKELESLAQQNQQEITRLTNEKLESELRHKNKELATSTVHILNKNEFIVHLKDHIKSVAKKSGKNEIAEELTKLTSEIESNLSSDSDWEHFQVHFDNVHGDFSRKFRATYPDLSPQDMKLCAYLRMNLSTKEIANLLNISIRGVEISRYRLRKKLKLDRSINLQEFILNF
jgi:ligand-binding sensor domain-containing protein/DNA-binding CsgD family transcriptional regulator